MSLRRILPCVCLLTLAGCESKPAPLTPLPSSNTALFRTVTDEDFESLVLESELPVMVDFWAPWCKPCLLMGPDVDAVAHEYRGRAIVAKLNVDENPRTVERYQVEGFPTLLFFKQGQLRQTLVGLQKRDELEEAMLSVLE